MAVSPQLGAEAAVAACGGVAAVLAAARVDLRHALGQPVVLPLPPLPVPPSGQAAGPQPASAAAARVSGQPGASLASGAVPPAAAPTAAEAFGDEKAAVAAAVLPEGPPAPDPAAEVDDSCPAAAGETAGEVQPPGDEAQAQQEPAEQPLPDKPPAEQAHAVVAAALQPVLFPLADYERLHAQLQQFGRQSGICLLTVAGMIPQPTLKSARWVAGRAVWGCTCVLSRP